MAGATDYGAAARGRPRDLQSPPAGLVGALLLGIAGGGFFDGILLHQILQWHHLLSGIGGLDLRVQVAADGCFHALMYVLAAAGLWIIWRRRPREALAPRTLWTGLLAGFGLWHLLDAVLSHWLLGIHRIRTDWGSPLLWDISWLVMFGLAPLAAAWLLHRRGGPRGPGSADAATRIAATLLITAAGLQAARPAAEGLPTIALFMPGMEQARIWQAVAAMSDELIWSDASGELVVFRPREGSRPWRLLGQGAMLVSGGGLPAGCFSYMRR